MSHEHPSVYIATYSNTDVYECLVGEAPIMRRCKDDWVNATQILKLCAFPKAKRTKILEKGVQQGLHEKVQGGYGRFQGTWIPLKDAQALAEEYSIDAETVPVLYVDVNDPDVIIPKKSKASGSASNGTPSKRKYVRKPTPKDSGTPKKMKFEDHLPPQAVFTQDYPPVLSRNGSSMGPMGTSSVPIHARGVPHVQNVASPHEFVPSDTMRGPHGSYSRPATFPHFAVPDTNFNQLPPQSQPQPQHQQLPNPYGKNDFPAGINDLSHQQMLYQQQQQQQQTQRHRPSVSNGTSTNETNWSQEEHTRDSDTSLSSADGKAGHAHDDESSHVSQLLRFFSEDNAPIPYFLYNPPSDFNPNAAIDDEGHATLHWAAAVGNLNLVHLLLSKGASPLVVSHYGLNPLSKCIGFTNCYDSQNFAHVVAALDACLINTDVNGRTPLHYACQFSKVPSKRPALIFYLDVMLAKLRAMARHSSAGVDLMKNVLDHQDVNGDTCLHLAARARCTQIVKFFLANGARDDLQDVNNQTAKQLIVQSDLLVYNYGPQPAVNAGSHTQQMPNGLGTPIRGFSRMAETPDTQRTTVEDDVDEIHDHVSSEHLQSLVASQENKENIFIDDPAKSAHRAMSTPKQPRHQQPPPAFVVHAPKSNVLGVIEEREPSAQSSPVNREGSSAMSEVSTNEVATDVKLPMEDVSAMVSGMMHSLSKSYREQLSGLRAEQDRVKSDLGEKRALDKTCATKVKLLLERNSFKGANKLQDAATEVATETGEYAVELKRKEAQLHCTLGKLHAFELAGRVEEQESRIGQLESHSPAVDAEKWALMVELSQAQLKRRSLAEQLTESVRDFAISSKMNKYRKLISLSCGLKVEDIDGLIDGIEASLSEGTLQA